MLEEVEWMQISAAVDVLDAMEKEEERKEEEAEAHGVVVPDHRQPGKGSVTDWSLVDDQ